MNVSNLYEWTGTYGYGVIPFLFMLGIMGFIPLPEETSMVAIGIGVSKGTLPFGLSVLLAYLGTVCGMTTSYMIGRAFGHAVIGKIGRRFGMTEDRLHKVNGLFLKYGTWTLAFGYFIPVFRLFTAYAAGISRHSFGRFAVAAYLGAGGWILLFVSLGMAAGRYLGAFSGSALFLLIMACLTILALIVYKRLKRRK